jgi:hypothetical protein
VALDLLVVRVRLEALLALGEAVEAKRVGSHGMGNQLIPG